MDPFFKVEVINATPNPQQTIYAAMHQDYSENFVWDERDHFPSEEKCGEIAVKRLLAGGRGHFGCYSADTEVLTDSGWIRWDSVTDSMLLLAVDPNTGFSKFEAPKTLQVYDFDSSDKMYSLQSSAFDVLVTQNHRMVVSTRKKDGTWSEWGFKSAAEIHNKPVRHLMNCCLTDDDRLVPEGLPASIELHTLMKIAGFYFGDGERPTRKDSSSIRFRLRRPRKIAYLYSLGLDAAEKAGDRYVISNQELARWLYANFTTETNKAVPQWILTLPQSLVAAFWDGLKNSDGTHIKEKSWCYDSCEKEALDTIQATAIVNGFSANMTLNNKQEGEKHQNHRPCWRIHVSEHHTRRVEACQKGRSPGVEESLVNYQGKVYCATVSTGALMVRRNGKHIVCGNSLEHPQITLNFGYFPHSTMQQMRTHRTGISFDVQSGRYSGQRIIDVAEGKRDIEEVFYLRPVGEYSDRQGKRYEYTEHLRSFDLEWCLHASRRYAARIDQGFSEEHARGLIPFDVRQHWVMSANVRTILHLMDLRFKPDAQLECQQLCELMWEPFKAWVPAIAQWYEDNRMKKARLSP